MDKIMALFTSLYLGGHDVEQDRDRGAGIAEYALLVAGIAVVALVGIGVFGDDVNAFFEGLSGDLGF